MPTEVMDKRQPIFDRSKLVSRQVLPATTQAPAKPQPATPSQNPETRLVGATVRATFIDGSTVVGKLTQLHRYALVLVDEGGGQRLLYKHGLRSLERVEP